MQASAHSLSSSQLVCSAGSLLLLAVCTHASDEPPWQLHGFLTQGAFHTSDNNFYGESDDGLSTEFNETGLNASVLLPGSVRIAGQVIARNVGNYDNGSPRTDYFSIDWKFWQHDTSIAGIRIGRLRNPYGLFNETRDVAHTRPSIYVPAVVYMEVIRDVLISRDGVALYGELYGDNGTLALEVGGGEHKVTDKLISESMLADISGIDVSNSKMGIARILWESADTSWRAALGGAKFQNDVEYRRLPGSFDLGAMVMSLQYSTAQWQLTSEYLRFDLDLEAGPLVIERPGEAFYLQYNWFLPNQWQLYGRYEYGVWDRNHHNGSSMQQLCGVLDQFCYPRRTGYRRDAGIGARWDINHNWMVAAEAHYLEGIMVLSYLDNLDTDTTATYWTLLGLEVAFRF